MIIETRDRAAVQRVLIRAAVVAGLALAAAGTQFWLEGRSAAAPAVESQAEVLVTARAIEAGTLLTPADLRWQRWPAGAIAADWLVRDRGSTVMTDRVVTVRLAAGTPLTPVMATPAGTGGSFAAGIGAGRRAVTIAVTPAAGLAGFVAPGDRVDVLLVQALGSRRTGQTLLQAITVLGIDQRRRGPRWRSVAWC